MVLAGLVGLRIRALYFTQTQRLSLGEVGLEEATESGTGGPANTVEVCSCPTEYTGDSCEVRSSGQTPHDFRLKACKLHEDMQFASSHVIAFRIVKSVELLFLFI